jgi:hypothetical protein
VRDELFASYARIGPRERVRAHLRLMESLIVRLVKARATVGCWREKAIAGILAALFISTAGRPALHGSEPGQVRKEAATAILCKCRGYGSPPFCCASVASFLRLALGGCGIVCTARMYGGDSRRARRRRLHIGLGCRFGGKRSYEVGYRFQHMSNAGIKRPNAGMNFHQLRVQYHF